MSRRSSCSSLKGERLLWRFMVISFCRQGINGFRGSISLYPYTTPLRRCDGRRERNSAPPARLARLCTIATRSEPSTGRADRPVTAELAGFLDSADVAAELDLDVAADLVVALNLLARTQRAIENAGAW
jgi:hypothetical protein